MSDDDVLDVKEWVEYARSDYGLAVKIADDPNPYYAKHVCYHCQQAAEKILKAYLIVQECKLPEKTHVLKRLLRSCVTHCSDFSCLLAACSVLDEYITTTRYPSMRKLTASHVEQALKDAAQVLDFTMAKLQEAGIDMAMTT